MASELEYGLQDNVDCGIKWCIDVSAWKTQLVLLDQSNNAGAIDVKMDEFVLEEKSSYKMLGLTFSSKLLKLHPIKLEPLFILWSFFLLRLFCISVNLPYGQASNTFAMPGLVLLVASGNHSISCKNGYARLLFLQLLPLMISWLIIKMYAA